MIAVAILVCGWMFCLGGYDVVDAEHHDVGSTRDGRVVKAMWNTAGTGWSEEEGAKRKFLGTPHVMRKRRAAGRGRIVQHIPSHEASRRDSVGLVTT